MESRWDTNGVSSHGSIDGILLGSYLNIFEQQWEMDEVPDQNGGFFPGNSWYD